MITAAKVKKFFITFLVFIIFAFPAFCEDHAGKYHKIVLENGATILCKHVPDSELVTIQLRVMSGLSNEGEYAGSGISHFLEHLLFKGAHDKTADQIRKEVKMMGGIINAATGMDSAYYYIIVSKEHFEEALSLLADMVMDLVFTDEELENEKQVVLKEIKLRRDDPTSRRMKLLFSSAYTENVYKYPIIGIEEKFKALKRGDIERYHGLAYAPSRIVVGITGGVKPGFALEVARKKMEGYEKSDAWQPQVRAEPVQHEQRIVTEDAEVILGYLSVGFHTTDLLSPGLYPGDVLSILLGEGNDSRLYRRLVKEKELLYSVASFNYTPKYPGLFMITGIGDPGRIEEAREEIFAVIGELKAGRISEEELERAKNFVMSDYLRSHERISSINSTMTSSQMYAKDPSFLDKYVEKIRGVGPASIRNFARKYLAADNSTTVVLVPSMLQGEIPPPEKIKEDHAGQQYEKELQRTVAPERTEQAGGVGPDKTEYFKLRNGMRVIIKRRGSLPLVSVSLAMPGGLRAESMENNGISNLTSSLVTKGTKTRDESEIIPVIEKMGGSINTFSGMNSMGIGMGLFSGDLEKGLDIFEDIVKNSVFPVEELEKQKKKTVAAIKASENDIFDKGLAELRSGIYGKHPYGMKSTGRIETVEGFSRKDCLDFYKRYWGPESSVLAVVGDVDIEQAARSIRKRFGAWRKRTSDIKSRKTMPLTEPVRKDISMKKEQALYLIGFQGVDVKDRRKYALTVLSSLLSGSDGLLFYTVREKYGFTYTSGAVSHPAFDPGYFVIYVATTEENLDNVKGEVTRLIDGLSQGKGLDKDEITASRNKLITAQLLSLQANSSYAMRMALDELYGLGYGDYRQYPLNIRSVTEEAVKQCASEILDLGKSATVFVHSEPRE